MVSAPAPDRDARVAMLTKRASLLAYPPALLCRHGLQDTSMREAGTLNMRHADAQELARHQSQRLPRHMHRNWKAVAAFDKLCSPCMCRSLLARVAGLSRFESVCCTAMAHVPDVRVDEYESQLGRKVAVVKELFRVFKGLPQFEVRSAAFRCWEINFDPP